jgi:hypothetical protein
MATRAINRKIPSLVVGFEYGWNVLLYCTKWLPEL